MSRRDPDGATWGYEWTTAGRLAATVDPAGGRTSIEYGPGGTEAATVDPAGRRLVLEHDDLGLVAGVLLPDGREWWYSHDGLGRLRQVVDPAGGVWKRSYDVVGRLRQVVDPSGVSRSLAWSSDGSWSVQDASGAVSRVGVDGLGRPVRVEETLAGSGALDGRVGPDPGASHSGNRAGVQELLGGEFPGGQSALGLVPGLENAADVRIVVRDRCGRVIEGLDGEGGLVRFIRDAAGRLIEGVSAGGRRTRFGWDACGRLAWVQDPSGATVRYGRDRAGRMSWREGPDGLVRYGWDACGRLAWVQDPVTGRTTWSYDVCGRVRSVRSEAWGRIRYGYDRAGQLVWVENALGGLTRYSYDAAGRLETVRRPDGSLVRRRYTPVDKVCELVGPGGARMRAGYDGAGRQLWQSDASGGRVSWEYDGSGRLARMLAGPEGEPGRLVCAVERHGRRVRVDGPDGAGDELVFDGAGRLVRHVRDGRLEGSWAWDGDGLCTEARGPGGARTVYERDDAGRLVRALVPGLGQVSFGWDDAGQLVWMGGPGLSQVWERDSAGRVRVHTARQGDRVTVTRLTWDGAGRLVGRTVTGPEITDEARNGPGAGEWARCGYDRSGQLALVDGPGGCVEYEWDRAGRLASRAVTGSGGVVKRFSYSWDDAGRLVGATGPGGRTRYEWDAAGQRTGQDGPGGNLSYGWDETGRLSWLARTGTGVTDSDAQDPGGAGLSGAGGSWHLGYDGLGLARRVGDVPLSWDLSGPVPELSGFGGHSVSQLPGAMVVDGRLVASGERLARPGTSMDPWAVPEAHAADGGVGLSAAGTVLVSGLELSGARVYDPGTCGFLSTDPAGDDGAPAEWPWMSNPYSYAGNDPAGFTDPTGLSPLSDADFDSWKHEHGGLTGWVSDHKDYLIGGAMAIAGGVLMATGVGGPLGGMLMGAGVDTIIQRATTGKVNYGEVAVSGILGAIGGGAASSFLSNGSKLAGKLGATALREAITTGAASGASAGAGTGGYRYLDSPGPHTTSGFLKATATGAAEGGVLGGAGGAAGHGIGSVAKTALGHLKPTTSGGIIYLRTDDNGILKPYVGQAKSPERFEARRGEHDRAYPACHFNFDTLEKNIEPGTELDRYEERWIRHYGGPTNKSHPDGGLSNKRHQMSEDRYQAAGGDPYGEEDG